ncbi:MAG: tRNA (adenosine(37)-N6)-threonylcarbamoyltransferase complex dimerization subunit type 1 TsaB [Bacteroidetes bacterium]|nr:tRNA (adenosine(37)-N6)-threonylcarbamoyltransferase complex dimerization subunit type 1 TsaB [Bacteroidota bacterium]
MPLILSIETATTNCSVALAKDGLVISENAVNEGYSHSEKLTLLVIDVLDKAGKKLRDVDAFAVSAGPGSYTGLRIGISTAKGFCYALDKPLISISTLDAMAYGMQKLSPGNMLCPMIDARRMEVYCGVYSSSLEVLQEPKAIVVEKDFQSPFRVSQKLILAGDGADKCTELFSGDSTIEIVKGFMPKAAFLATLAEEKFKAGNFENVGLFEPFYLKEFTPGPSKS